MHLRSASGILSTRPRLIDSSGRRLRSGGERMLALGLFALVLLIPGPAQAQYSLDDIPAAVEGLVRSTADDAYLVIEILGTEDFVQLGAHGEPVILDFPQITPRQRKFRQRIESVCEDLGLELTIVTGSNGAEFLDYELGQDPAEISAVVKAVLRRVYEVENSTRLYFEANGFDLAPPRPRDELATRVAHKVEGVAPPARFKEST